MKPTIVDPRCTVRIATVADVEDARLPCPGEIVHYVAPLATCETVREWDRLAFVVIDEDGDHYGPFPSKEAARACMARILGGAS